MLGGFVKAMRASHTFYDYSKLEETESALAISPCPRIEESTHIGENTEFANKRGGLDYRRRAQRSRQTGFDNNDLTESLAVGGAIAFAITIAAAIYVFCATCTGKAGRRSA
jgi:hypothetical protein